jgi:flagellar hook protein FlgE
MPLNAALNSAVSGLQAQSNALSVISTNIANASTTGYTTEGVDFDSLVDGSSDAQNNDNNYGGSGVSANTSYAMQTIGQVQTTTTSTNIALSASSTNGFFVVSPSASSTSSATDLYSRDGSFTQTSDGYLKNSSGDYLMGYATESDGTPTSTSVGELSALTPVQISPTVAAVATTTGTFTANLPAGLPTAATATTADPDNVVSYLTAIDSLGVTQSVTETWTNEGNDTWTLGLSDPTDSAGNTGTISPSSYQLVFNSDGSLYSIAAQTGTTTSGGVTTPTYGTPSTTDFNIAITLGGSGGVTTDLASGAAPSAITLDLSGMTQYASTASTNEIQITTNTTDGSAAGAASSVSISSSGLVSVTYSNNTTVDVSQIPLATFADEEGLTALSGSTFVASTASGSPTLVTPGTEGTGEVTGSAVNSSTTDTSTQFDDMITAEQAYSAAAQVVTYDTKMFDTLIQSISA